MTYLRIITILAILLAPTAVQAQLACGPRGSVVGQLSEKYGETQIGLGLANNVLIELWASREPPYTWSILKVNPKNWSCLIAVGTDGHWKDNDPLPTPFH